jgi:hypothetical protein
VSQGYFLDLKSPENTYPLSIFIIRIENVSSEKILSNCAVLDKVLAAYLTTC